MTNAIDIKNALSHIKLLQSIGNCPTMIQDYKGECGDGDWGDEGEEEDWDNEDKEDDEDKDEEEDSDDEETEAQKDIKSKGCINNVGIFQSQKLSLSTLKHSCRRQSRPFVIYSTVSRFPHQLGLSRGCSISELLMRAANLTPTSAHILFFSSSLNG
jgi:hypothetical protein